MNKLYNFVTTSAAWFWHGTSSKTDTALNDNTRGSDSPASESLPAFPSPPHQHGVASFLKRIPQRTYQALLLTNAKSSAKYDPVEFCCEFNADISKLTEESRTELVFWLALEMEVSSHLATHIQKFAISDETARIRLAEKIANEAPSALAENIQEFAISDERERLEFARIIAEKNPAALAANIQGFAISDERERVEFARIIAEKAPSVLAASIQKFAISDEKERLEFARIIAEKAPSALAANIQKFAISDEKERLEFARISAEKAPHALAANIQGFAISDENERVKLARILAEKAPSTFAANIQGLAISDERERLELARTLAEKVPFALAENIQRLAIPNESDRIDIARSVVGKVLSHFEPSALMNLRRLIKASPSPLLENFKISDQSIRANLYASVYLKLIVKGDIQPNDQALMKNFFSQPHEPMEMGRVADQFGNPHEFIVGLLKDAEEQKNPYIKKTLSAWSQLVSLRFAAVQVPEADWQGLKSPLQAIQKWRMPNTRYVLTDMLAQCGIPPATGDLNGFLAFCKRFTKPHTHLYSVLLFPLFQSMQDDPDLNSLITLLRHPDFKDSKRQKTVVNALLALVQADRLTDELKRALLRACLPSSGDKKEAVRALVQTASPLECLVSLAQENTHLGNSVLDRLKSIQSPSHFNEQMATLFQDLFSLQHLTDVQNVGEQFSRYWERSRQPVGLISYAVKMQSSLDEQEKASVLKAISQFVNAAVLSPHPERTFRELRYNPAASEHLHVLAGKAPKAFEQWQQACHYQPSDAFLADVSGSTKQTDQNEAHLETLHATQKDNQQDNKSFSIVDTDEPEDLFLCGTETDSCQSINGDSEYAKALMGYVLDGKYRMLAIKSADERVMGRRMLRVLWDESEQKPVLHLEKIYQNPGVPEKYKQALVELAQQKAKQMNCTLVSHDETLESSGNYPMPIKAYPTPLPFEYVDAQGLGIQNGETGYELSGARIVG